MCAYDDHVTTGFCKRPNIQLSRVHAGTDGGSRFLPHDGRVQRPRVQAPYL